VVADAALSSGWRDVILYDDGFPAVATTGGWSIAGTSADLLRRVREFDGLVVAIGDNHIRLDRQRRLTDAGASLVTVVHPRAWASDGAAIGAGSVLSAGAVVNIGATIGIASIVNTGATVDHDCVIGEGVHIAPGAHLSGAVRVGPLSWIGVGASVRQGVVIGAGVMIGAGAVVVSNIPDGVTAVGCPARPKT
jgi:sugar O-acyltransferase (sialic acid O-acetyltransferase NeuD family)